MLLVGETYFVFKKANQRFLMEENICLDMLYVKKFTVPSFAIAARILLELFHLLQKNTEIKFEEVSFIVVLPVCFRFDYESDALKILCCFILSGIPVFPNIHFDTQAILYI